MIKKTLFGIVAFSLCSSQIFAADFGSNKNRVDRLEKIYDELPVEVQEQVEALKKARGSLRDVLKDDYLGGLGDGATADEKAAAIAQFKEDYADQIQSHRELASEAIEKIRENLPRRSEASREIRALVNEHKVAKSALKTTLRETLDVLPENATREEIKAAKQAFAEANSEAIAANKRLAQEIRELTKELKKERKASSVELSSKVVERSVLSPGLADARETFLEERSDFWSDYFEWSIESWRNLSLLQGEEFEEALLERRAQKRRLLSEEFNSSFREFREIAEAQRVLALEEDD
ncbi:hypothetical protein MLD52_06935 [Puniceicoccaceae bacterium K14]|nr:hypothetical protein [Puniceicoccaceae bacterium K14]